MDYLKVGNSGFGTSRLILGSWKNIGERLDLNQSRQLVTTAIEEGMSTFDTADVYGAAEETLGRLFGELVRQDFSVISKCYWPTGNGPNGRGLSRKHIRYSIDRSLERLNLDYLDVFMCHRHDPEVPLEEVISSFNDLIRQGKILHWAVSQWPPEVIIETYRICGERGWEAPICDQTEYSLLNRRRVEIELAQAKQETGISIMGWSPLASGVLAGRTQDAGNNAESLLGTVSVSIRGKYSTQDTHTKAALLSKLAAESGIGIVGLALGWLLSQGKADSLVVGASSASQIRETVRASRTQIGPDLIAKIEEIFPRDGALS